MSKQLRLHAKFDDGGNRSEVIYLLRGKSPRRAIAHDGDLVC
ncbi:MAG: hypothetical protein WBA57_02560 [Elainellaceae cyanobacterium]